MSIRRAQDERIEGTPDGNTAIVEIVDVPDAPTIGTATAGVETASVTFTAAVTGGTATTFRAISTPGSIEGTSATSPITISGLTGGTAYTFQVRGENSTGNGAYSSASNSVTPTKADAMDPLQVITLGGSGASSITFSNIPSTYTHLQIRAISMHPSSDGLCGRINGDTGTNYTYHEIYGTGSAAGAQAETGKTALLEFGGSPNTTSPGAYIIDILDYANTNKYKTVRTLAGYDANGSGIVRLVSQLWLNTNAITSLSFYGTSSNLSQYSQFALYGVRS